MNKYKPNTLPRIYTESSLLNYLKIPKKIIHKILKDNTKYYIEFDKLVKDKSRHFFSCESQLKSILIKINKEYLQLINFPEFIHCGPKNRSVDSFLNKHNKYRYHIKCDIKNFFPTVTKDLAHKALNYFNIPKKINNLICSVAITQNQLPQGFSTSPILSAIVICYALKDIKMNEDCKISFYIDDGLISGAKIESCEALLKEIETSLNKHGLFLNKEKTIYAYKKYIINNYKSNHNQVFKILGKVINDNVNNVPRILVNNFYKEILSMDKNSFLSLGNKFKENILGRYRYIFNNTNISKKSKIQKRVEHFSSSLINYEIPISKKVKL